MTLPATENFSYTANSVIPNPPWTQLSNLTNANVIEASGGTSGVCQVSTSDCMAVWNNDTFTADQYSQFTAQYTPSSGTFGAVYLYLGVRCTKNVSSGGVGANCTFYWFWTDGGSDTALLKDVSGTTTVLATANTNTFTSGDILKMSITGSSISITKNGSAYISATDSSITTAAPPAMGGFGANGNFNTWKGDDISSPSSVFAMLRRSSEVYKWRMAQTWFALRKVIHAPFREHVRRSELECV